MSIFTLLKYSRSSRGRLVLTTGYQGSETRKEIRILNQNFIYNSINPGAIAIYFPTPDVNGNFNALNANINRNFSNWQFAANYRWSKSMDELSYGGPGAVTNQTYPRDQKLEYGPSDFDATHYFNFSSVYELPFFRGSIGHDRQPARRLQDQPHLHLQLRTSLDAGYYPDLPPRRQPVPQPVPPQRRAANARL